MGLLDNQTQSQYYGNTSNYGNYQFVSLENIINAFMVIHVGEGKIISKVSRTDVQFHAMRAIQELSYDVFRSIKSQEIKLPSSLKMILPHDYVNYVSISCVGDDGIHKNLYPTGKTSNPMRIKQDADGEYLFADVDNDGSPDNLNTGGGNPYVHQDSVSWENYKSSSGAVSSTDATDAYDIELDYRGRRYGLEPQFAHQHGTFYIDLLRGFVHFSSSLNSKTIVLKYISDSLGTDAEMVVHKFCEEAVYKHVMYAILATRSNIPEYIVARYKRERFAETRKAKIRLSNIKIEEFTQVLKGMSKQIK
tara:strand:+ start:936 stop:1853 length:918 start_codon:yes stop_codon:yes gene_type:complete